MCHDQVRAEHPGNLFYSCGPFPAQEGLQRCCLKPAATVLLPEPTKGCWPPEESEAERDNLAHHGPADMKNPQCAGSRVKHREEEGCKSLEKAPGCAGTEPFGTEVITGHL